MKNAVRLFAKVAMFYMIAIAFLPIKSYAQTTQPRNGEIYYYQESLGEYTYYMAVQFVDGGIRVITSSLMENESLQKFKMRVPKEISEVKMIKYKGKTKDNHHIYVFSEDRGDWGYYEESWSFSNSYKELLYYIYDEVEGDQSSRFTLVR